MQPSLSSIDRKVNLYSTISDFKQLTKVGLSISVLFSSLVGYLLAVQDIQISILVMLCVGGFFLVGASNAFNQVIEKETDSLMERTKNRPLPTGRISVTTAMILSVIMTILGIIILYNINPKSAFFGAISVFLYTCAYTPLKSVTPLAVFVGAIPGAIPFMLGWVAATNKFSIEPGMLFLIQFFWQFPHFWSIAWVQYSDYKKAGFELLPTKEKNSFAVMQIILYIFFMIIASVIPVFRITGSFYILPATAFLIFVLGLYILVCALKLYKNQNDTTARKLMLVSVIYITLVQIIYVVDKFLH